MTDEQGSSGADSALLMGVDGGQTGTRAILTRTDGTVLGQGRGGPLDHFHIAGGTMRNRAAIQGAILDAFANAESEPGYLGALALGLTGVQGEGGEETIVESIVREIVDPQHLLVVPDYVTNLAGASEGEPGVVVIAGGGAIAYGATADGRTALAGGYGYLLGDEGSGYDIGRRAVIAALRASDGRDRPTALESAIKSTFRMHRAREIKGIVYSQDFSRDRFAGLVPLVVEIAQAGDDVAREILEYAGHELARAALAVLSRLYEPHEPARVYLTGGVFHAGEHVVGPFRETLRAGWPEASASSGKHSPLIGALILARRLCGLQSLPAPT